MTATNLNWLKATISNTPGTAGGFTLAAPAAGGYLLPVVGNDGQAIDLEIGEGTAKEMRTGCIYTHASTSFSRGTFAASTSGAAISFTAAAVITNTPHAAWANSVLRLATLAGTKDGSNAAFTLSLLPVASVIVVLNGVCLSVAGGGFTFSNTAVNMSAGYIPASTDDLYAFVQ